MLLTSKILKVVIATEDVEYDVIFLYKLKQNFLINLNIFCDL